MVQNFIQFKRSTFHRIINVVLSLTVPGCLRLIISLFISFSLRSIFCYRLPVPPREISTFFLVVDIFNNVLHTLLSNHITPIKFHVSMYVHNVKQCSCILWFMKIIYCKLSPLMFNIQFVLTFCHIDTVCCCTGI